MFCKDYNFGTQSQKVVLPLIQKFFNKEIKETEGKYCSYDFEDEETIYELKARNNAYSTYPTTMLPFDKVIGGKQQIFLFKFTDGLYYIKYEKELFNTFLKKDFRRYRQGVNDREKPYIYIPIEHLKLIE